MTGEAVGFRRVVHGFDRVLTWVEYIFVAAASLLLVAMMLIVSYSVVGRYFFNLPGAWSVELSEYMMLFIAFLVGAWVLKEDAHVQVELITDKLPPRIRHNVATVMMSIAAIACLILFWFSLQTTIDHYERNVTLINILSVKKYILLTIIPIGSIFLFFRFLRKIFAQFGF